MATGQELVNQQALQQALANVSLALVDMTANPKPNYSVDGASYSWQSLFDSLMAKQRELRIAIQECDGAFEVTQFGRF